MLRITPKAQPSDAKKLPVTKTPNVFGEDSDEEEEEISDPQKYVMKQHEEIGRKAQVVQEEQQDPSIYDFDSYYDTMKAEQRKKEEARQEQKKKERQTSKYIDNLKKAAEQRKYEREIARERQIMKEQEKEKDLYGETEAFVTSSYLKKMQERKIWEEEQKKLQAKEEDVTKRGMSSFYSKLLSNLSPEEKAVTQSAKTQDKSTTTKQETNKDTKRETKHREDRKDERKDYRRRSRSPVYKDRDNRDRRREADRKRDYDQVVDEAEKPREEPPPKATKEDKTDTVNAARERYLQRMAEKNK
jgi:coiled-coil domain-containing protein 55